MQFGFGVIGAIFPILFCLIFLCVFSMFAFIMISTLKTWNKNNHSPRLTVNAKVVAKREDVSHHHHHSSAGAGGYHTTSSTSYYVTFEVDSGDRMELCVSGAEYGMLVEGDCGKLSFQGTRYLSFERGYFS